jgi:hypothetical protein
VIDRKRLDPDIQIMTKPFDMEVFSRRIADMLAIEQEVFVNPTASRPS